jgi:hypothetical protein
MGHAKTIDYPRWTKRSFLFGVGLFALGALGELLASTLLGPLPGWEQMLLFDAEVLGLLIALFAPILFGIVLPLTE